MTVAVEKGLDNMKKALLKMGYTVVDAKSNIYADAYVFSGGQNSALSSNMCLSQEHNGVLLINVRNKSAEDIDRILKSRLYSPIFKF